jgi:uncharacterized protein YbjT (DUF2867 family)
MKLTIFAAAGGIGRQILEQAIDAGHDVTAVVRNPQKLPAKLSRQDLPDGPRAIPPPRRLLSRADVAHYLLRALDQPETIRQTIGLAN